jgi:hypothetical protein
VAQPSAAQPSRTLVDPAFALYEPI